MKKFDRGVRELSYILDSPILNRKKKLNGIYLEFDKQMICKQFQNVTNFEEALQDIFTKACGFDCAVIKDGTTKSGNFWVHVVQWSI